MQPQKDALCSEPKSLRGMFWLNGSTNTHISKGQDLIRDMYNVEKRQICFIFLLVFGTV